MENLLFYWGTATGAAHAAVGLVAWMWPDTVRRLLERFPRHRGSGRMLAALALFWAAAIVRAAPLGRFEPLKPAIYIGAPLTWAAAIFFMDELLAPRALGGLLLLLAHPLLSAARLHPHPAAAVASALAYGWVGAGMTLVVAPWHFRRAVASMARSAARWRATAASMGVLGVAFMALAFTVYR